MRSPTRPLVRVAACAVWLGCAAGGAADGAPPVEPGPFVARYAELHARGAVDDLLALHTPDSEFRIPGQPPLVGSQALRNLFEWDAALRSRLEISEVRVDGEDLVLGSIVERNALFEALGLASVRYLAGTRLVLRDGRIARTEPAVLEPATLAALSSALERATDWLRRYRAGDLARHLPAGSFRYDAESARWWTAVLDDRRAADAARTPGSEAAERLGRQLMACWSTGDVSSLAGIVAPDAVYEENVEGARVVGPEGFARYVSHVHGWASEVELAIDRVATGPAHAHFEWRMSAVQSRPIAGRVSVASGRRVAVRGATLVEVRDGRIVRAADHLDALGFVLSLGARVELPGGTVIEGGGHGAER